MKFYCLPNLSSQDVFEGDPLNPPEMPDFEDKKEFRAWCEKPNTNYLFFSHVEGVTPSNRITVANSPYRLHGVTADFDSEQTPDEVRSIVSRNAPAGLLPRYLSFTFSGNVRLTWEFAEPMLVDSSEVSEKFMRILYGRLGMNNLLAGFDQSSLKLAQYFAAGSGWEEFPGWKPISERMLSSWWYDAATQTKMKVDGPKIPIAAVAAEVEKRWPGRIEKLEEGLRLPLFWIEPFENRVGSQVGEFGMLCYSSRAGKSFCSWQEILGPEFMRQFHSERVGKAVDGLFFDGDKYWARLATGEWADSKKEDTSADLEIECGLTPGEVKKALNVIRKTRRVFGVFPFIHNKNTVIQTDQGACLNVSRIKLVKSAEEDGESPWLDEFFTKLWDPKFPEQYDYFMSWFHRLYTTARDGEMKQGQAVFIAGPTGQGKTLLGRKIVGAALGGFADAASYILGKTEFNKEAAEKAVWCVDDNRGGSTWEKHDELSNAIKRMVANPSIPYHPKYRDATTLTWMGRIMVTCNLDAASLSILPVIDDSNMEKIMLFKASDWLPSFEYPDGIEPVIAKELPFFLRKLEGWSIPDAVRDKARFGVHFWHHPELLEESAYSSASGQLSELMPMLIRNMKDSDNKDETERWMTAAEIRGQMDDEKLRNNISKFGGSRLGIALSSPLMGRYVLDRKRIKGHRKYLINLKATE